MRKVPALYMHVPFCRKKCLYCDFPVLAITPHAEYSHKLVKEIAVTRERWEAHGKLTSIYVGGGTPTLLPDLPEVISAAKSSFGVTDDCEITVETEPGTLDDKLLQKLLDVGVNRFSVGVQLLNDEVLKAAGRAHSVKEVLETVELLKLNPTPKSISVDVIVGLPHSTWNDWEATLDQVLDWEVDHISTYLLTLEDGTPFAKKYLEGVQPLPSVDSVCDMYLRANERLTEAGFDHYEISNYARPHKQSRHNSNYWKGSSYFYGVGLGAASFVDDVRLVRPKRLASYYEWVDNIPTSLTTQSELDLIKDTLMYQIRRKEGVDCNELINRHGTSLASLFSRLIEQYPNLLSLEDGYMKLKGPEAYLLSNEVLSTGFALLEEQG